MLERLDRPLVPFSVIPAQAGDVIPAKAGIYLNRFPIKSGMTTEFRVKHGMTMVKIQWIEIISRKGQKKTNKLTN